jgi:molybdopterin/thiamine biosynthesis adenylyltransferase
LELRKVAVIGVGTLGSFVSKHLSELHEVKELVIVDNDFVEIKDTFRSIYDYSKVGDYKVNALKQIINSDVSVTAINQKYVEGETKLPECDLIIDCRDVVCNRLNEIDVRLYISGKVLIVDCRKRVTTGCSYDGAYSIALTKAEINKAAFFATQIIHSNQLDNLIENNLIQRLDLDLLPDLLDKAIKKALDNKMDIIYELSDGSERLLSLEENIKPIMSLNRANDVDVYVSEKPKPKPFPTKILDKIIPFKMPEPARTRYEVIPKGTLIDSNDVVTALSAIVKKHKSISNFIVTTGIKDGRNFIELLEETGAA